MRIIVRMGRWSLYAKYEIPDKLDYPRIRLIGESVDIDAKDEAAVFAEMKARGMEHGVAVELDAAGGFKSRGAGVVDVLTFDSNGRVSKWWLYGVGPQTL